MWTTESSRRRRGGRGEPQSLILPPPPLLPFLSPTPPRRAREAKRGRGELLPAEESAPGAGMCEDAAEPRLKAAGR